MLAPTEEYIMSDFGPLQIQVQAIGGTVGGTAISTRGDELDVGYFDTMTLFVDYVAGTEGTIYIYPKFRHATGGTAYQWQTWTATAGDKTVTTNRLALTASGSYYATFDVRGVQYAQFYSQTVGTPTGALGLFVTLTD